jgi:hypothetical protein
MLLECDPNKRITAPDALDFLQVFHTASPCHQESCGAADVQTAAQEATRC